MEERIETYEEERVEIYAESNFDSADEAEEVSEGGKKDKEDNNGEPERVVPKKRTIRNPRPKLDENRLMSQKGLVALEQYFKDVELKGKGHELEDLDLIMGKLQLWVHRLFPRMKFDDSLEKIEALGHKKSIQVRRNRNRWDAVDKVFREDQCGSRNGRLKRFGRIERRACELRLEILGTAVMTVVKMTDWQKSSLLINRLGPSESRSAKKKAAKT
nr:EOG090X0AVC [Artemia franciscana]